MRFFAGDVFFIPAGRVHAIGKGILLAEIQETSDVTYRIYDYDRKDAEEISASCTTIWQQMSLILPIWMTIKPDIRFRKTNLPK